MTRPNQTLQTPSRRSERLKDEVIAKLRQWWLILFSLGGNELATQFEREQI
jgi:hypothetical protein